MPVIIMLVLWKEAGILISYIAPFFIGYVGLFPYKELFGFSNLPQYITSFANFDGIHYVVIAYQGYLKYEQAFFPVYPLLLKAVYPLVKDYFLAGLLISNIAFVAGFLVFKKYLVSLKLPTASVMWTMLLLLSFPTSFFFGALYTEGLFFLLTVSSLYFVHKKNYLLASTCAFLAALTRFVGVFLFMYFAVIFILELLKQKKKTDGIFKNKGLLLTVISPLAGLLTYCTYLFITTGDPFFFFRAQKAFEGRSLSLIFLPQVYYRYVRIFLGASFNYPYLVSVFEFLFFNFVFIVLIADLYRLLKRKLYLQNPHRLALSLFSLTNIVIPTFTGTLSSIPRYALLSISLFIFLAEIKQTAIKILLLITFITLHIITLAFYIQGYFVG